MSAVERTARYQVNRPEIVDSVVDGEVVAINLSTGSYYSISGTGTAVWAVLDRPTAIPDVVDRLGEHYDAPVDEIDGSVTRFVNELVTEGLIRPGDASSPGPDTVAPLAPDGRGAFSPPTLEKFTDMEDLLLLDPVHDVSEQGWPHVRNT